MTKHDYEVLIIPPVRQAVKEHGRVRLYCEIDRTFSGLDADAIWDDVSLGLQTFAHWERIAVVTDVEWIAQATRVFAVVVPFGMKVFPMTQAPAARAWIVSP